MFLFVSLRRLLLPAHSIESSDITEGIGKARRLSEFPGESQGLGASLQRLVWIAEPVQDMGQLRETNHPRVLRPKERSIPLRVREGKTLLEVGPSEDEGCHHMKGRRAREMGAQEEEISLQALAQGKQLLGQFVSGG